MMPPHPFWLRLRAPAFAERFGWSVRRAGTHLSDWYGAADLFCLPTTREGSANVLREALACGVPCITTPVGGNPDVISSPDVGTLVPPDPAAMGRAIAAGLLRDWDREHISELARRRTWKVVAEECHHHLKGSVNSPRTPAT